MIEQTSCALTIDINPSARGRDMLANEQAFSLVAKHIKWRRLSGNCLIDVAGLEHFSTHDKLHLETILKRQTQEDFVSTTVLGWSKLGFLEFQRPRRYSPLEFLVKK